MVPWVMVVNKYSSAVVRIHVDRGHRVVTSGPYRRIRHPGYLGAIVIYLGAPLALGSVWALVPAAGILVLTVLRTALEDRTVQDELPGYSEYAGAVGFRLVPGVW